MARIHWLHDDKYGLERAELASRPSCPYTSVDPSPPALSTDVSKLSTILLDENNNLFERYRAMFSLRNIGTIILL